jgi:NUMOD4 motif/HNH endonuclease
VAESLLEFLERYSVPVAWFAELAGLSIDDVHALSEGAALAPPPRAGAIVALLKSAGIAKAGSVIRRFELGHADPDWRPIPGFPAYEASSCGRIRRIRSSNFGLRVLKPMIGNRGYWKVTLYDPSGNQRAVMIHRAVCLAWHGFPEKGRDLACHRNGDHLDNRSENLYWGTAIENAKDCLRHGRHSSQNQGKYVQNAYTRNTPRKIRIAFEQNVLTRKQYLAELNAFHTAREEHVLHTGGVAGSIPAAPTIKTL